MKWKLALAQHPMYLLIREDTQCAERTPPWGAPDIESYIGRVRQNLEALRCYSRLKLGYEWSGVELELLALDAPNMLGQMREYAQKGLVQFYNGTYAQPHLQILSSEANLRQFQYGAETYSELGLGRVRTYAHQEASVHEQVPQLLRAFGIEFAAVPGFLSTLVWLEEGELTLHGVRGPRFVQGREFAAWEGLDGTQVPLYLHQPIPPEMSLAETLAREVVLGQLSIPPVLIDMPDMIDIGPEWMAVREGVEFVLLDEALEERLQRSPRQPRARLYTHWSYLQGIRAEELSRTNFQAERSALRAEAMQALAFILLDKPPKSIHPVWKTILTCQHHDVYCFSAPELRDKAIGWLREAETDARRLTQEAGQAVAQGIDTRGRDGQVVVLFNTLPIAMTAVAETEALAGLVTPTDCQDKSIPAEATLLEDGRARLRFAVHLPGLGYTSCALVSGDYEVSAWRETREELEFENPFLRARVSLEGVFRSLQVQPDGFELLDGGRGGGNRLTATDSQATSLNQESAHDSHSFQEHLVRLTSDPPMRGPKLHWEETSPTLLLRSPLGVSLMATGKLGEKIRAQALIRFYHKLPRIDLTWTFDFQQASVGTFFDDDTKLSVRWPLAFNAQIFHDIPFGVVRTHPGRVVFPTTWVDLSDGSRGAAFFHQGTPKHWVDEDMLINLLAWGEDTDAIHNGLGRNRWLKAFDQRLNGIHRIESAIYVHPGDWRSGAVTEAAVAYRFPPVAIHTGSHPGSLPAELDVLHLEDPGLIATAVFMQGERIICRAYAAKGQPASGSAHLKGLSREGFRTIAGEATSNLNPYQIGELAYRREERCE